LTAVQIDVSVEEVIDAPRHNLNRVKRAVKGAVAEIFEPDGFTPATLYNDLALTDPVTTDLTTNEEGIVVVKDTGDRPYTPSAALVARASKGTKSWEKPISAIDPSEIMAGEFPEVAIAGATTTDAPGETIYGRLVNRGHAHSNGIVYRSPADGAAPVGGYPYGTMQAIEVLKSGVGDVKADLIRARIDGYTGGIGSGAGYHSYAGYHQPSDLPAPTTSYWSQHYIDAPGGFVHTAANETPTGDPIIAGTPGGKQQFIVGPNGQMYLYGLTTGDDAYFNLGWANTIKAQLALAAGASHFGSSMNAGDLAIRNTDTAKSIRHVIGSVERLGVSASGVKVGLDDILASGLFFGSAGFFNVAHASAAAGGIAFNSSGDVILSGASDSHPVQIAIPGTALATFKSTGITLAAILDMGSHQIQNLTDGSAAQHGATYGQVLLKSLLTTKGDIVAATASATPARVGVSGTDGRVLQEDSSQSAGVKFGKILESAMETGSAGLAKGLISVYRHAALNIAASGVATLVPFDTEEIDVSGWHDVTTNVGRYTPLVAAYYRFSALVQTSGVPLTALQAVYLYKNGALVKSGPVTAQGRNANNFGSLMNAIVAANGSTDYFEVYALQTDTAVHPILVDGINNHFEVNMVGRS
jgi:hypothetical protein